MPGAGLGTASEAAEQTPEEIAEVLRGYLRGHAGAVLLEDGRTLFDLRSAEWAVAAEHGRCSLQVWSEEKNIVRRVVAAVPRPGGSLRMRVLKMGQGRPHGMDWVTGTEGRTVSGREATRARYVRLLERVLGRVFPDERVEGLRTAMDLERSFGPAYARGVMRRGRECWAVVGVNGAESAATVDGVLTVGLLWLTYCREKAGGKRLFGGLRVVVPKGMEATTRARLAWMDGRFARYELFALEERTEGMEGLDAADNGNLATRLLDAPNQAAAVAADGRFAGAMARVVALLPEGTRVVGLDGTNEVERMAVGGTAHARVAWVEATAPVAEVRLRTAAELVFLVHGMEFARARAGYAGGSFNRQVEVWVGSGPREELLTEGNAAEMRGRVGELFARRTALGEGRDALFRAAPESWLGSMLRGRLPEVDAELEPAPVYTEVAAMTGGGRTLDRGMLDLLGVTREGRLAVIEIKATEDLQMAMQGLDYWIRVRHHHLGSVDGATGLGELQQRGYFAGMRLRAEAPDLFLVAPALQVHPATETVLRYFDERVRWTLVALDQRWRSGIRVVWRKRSSDRGRV